MFVSLLMLGLLGAGAVWAEPVTVESATLQVDYPKGTATFGGGVTVTQGDTVLTAPVAVVTYGPNGKGNVKEIVTQGRTHIRRSGTNGAETADADTATYVPQSRVLTLTGNVELVQGTNTLRGERLIYDVASGKIRLGGGSGVSGRFETK